MASNPITRIAERAAESLYEDEKLRSNLTDSEAEIVLNWASEWLSAQVSAALDEATAQKIAQTTGQQVRQVVSTLNSLAKKGPFTNKQGMAALEPLLKQDPSLPRRDLVTIVGNLTQAQNMQQ